jgi:hypothetical protein
MRSTSSHGRADAFDCLPSLSCVTIAKATARPSSSVEGERPRAAHTAAPNAWTPWNCRNKNCAHDAQGNGKNERGRAEGREVREGRREGD